MAKGCSAGLVLWAGLIGVAVAAYQEKAWQAAGIVLLCGVILYLMGDTSGKDD